MMLKLKPTIGRRRLTLQAVALVQALLVMFAGTAVALVQALLVMFAGTAASAQEGNRLQDIQVQSLSGQRIELKLIMSETAPEPLAFTIENPARIASIRFLPRRPTAARESS
jgi:hypothetical protein